MPVTGDAKVTTSRMFISFTSCGSRAILAARIPPWLCPVSNTGWLPGFTPAFR